MYASLAIDRISASSADAATPFAGAAVPPGGGAGAVQA